ncbi:MAG: flagellar biosynthetic protein FliQ [Planctomycetaceae bacterium]
MSLDAAINLTRQALWLGLLLGAPFLAVSVAIGLLMSLLQALTQIQDQTLSFVPRLAIGAATLLFVLPWIFGRLVEYAQQLYSDIPTGFAGY